MNFLQNELVWVREPKQSVITENAVEIITEPGTDLWQRTYYGFQNDNAPILQMKTSEKYFSFTVKTAFNSKHRFDQCGVAIWATADISAEIREMWYRLSRRESDYCLESSADGVVFRQMRICHMPKGADEITFGIYACSPEQSSFKAVFTDMQVTECKWQAHC